MALTQGNGIACGAGVDRVFRENLGNSGGFWDSTFFFLKKKRNREREKRYNKENKEALGRKPRIISCGGRGDQGTPDR